MKRSLLLLAFVAALLMSGAPASTPLAAANTIPVESPANPNAPLVTIDTVLVGSPGNAADPATGYGAVAAEFRIGTAEVTINQYVAFLNAVARVPAHPAIESLWTEEMEDPKGKEDTGILITRAGAGTEADPYLYAVAPSAQWGDDAGNRPAPWVTWFNAARFANWLHNGATAGADTEDGAYTLVDHQESGIVPRNPNALWWIPSEDEWYKAAYYDPAKPGGAGYWQYPTRSDAPPRMAEAPGTAPAANFNNVYLAHQEDGWGVLTPVCAYVGTRGPWGTCDQAGLLWEWTAGIYVDPEGPNRIVRGGSWGPGVTPPMKTIRRDYGPMGSAGYYRDDDTGFRLAAPAVDE